MMEIIKVEKRQENSKAKQLRRAGIIPCSVYGGALENSISIQTDKKTADNLCRTKREGSTVRLDLDGEKIPSQIKELSFNPLSGAIEHISFQALKADMPVNSVAHILTSGRDDIPGILEQEVFEVPFTSLPRDMVDTVAIDLTKLPVGTSLTIADIPEFQTDKITLKLAPDTLVLRIRDKIRVADEEEESEPAAE